MYLSTYIPTYFLNYLGNRGSCWILLTKRDSTHCHNGIVTYFNSFPHLKRNILIFTSYSVANSLHNENAHYLQCRRRRESTLRGVIRTNLHGRQYKWGDLSVVTRTRRSHRLFQRNHYSTWYATYWGKSIKTNLPYLTEHSIQDVLQWHH